MSVSCDIVNDKDEKTGQEGRGRQEKQRYLLECLFLSVAENDNSQQVSVCLYVCLHMRVFLCVCACGACVCECACVSVSKRV